MKITNDLQFRIINAPIHRHGVARVGYSRHGVTRVGVARDGDDGHDDARDFLRE